MGGEGGTTSGMGVGGVSKLCVRCGEDCADRPRVRTRDGRYMCKACEAQLAGQSVGHSAGQSVGQARGNLASAGVAPASDDGTIPLAEDHTIPIAVDTTIPLEEPSPRRSAKEAFAPKGVPTGGAAVAAGVAAGPLVNACVKCGYSLAGVSAPRCPECGTLNTKYAVRRERDAQDSAEVERKAYMQPIGLFLVCFAAVVFLAFQSGGTGKAVQQSFLTLLNAGVGFFAFTTCCLIWIGFDAPWHLNLVRFLAISAATSAMYQITGMLPATLVWNIGVLFLYIGMLQKFLDLDLQDALLVGVITSGLRWGLVLLMAIMLA